MPTSPSKWRRTTVVKRKTVDSGKLQQARLLAKDVFGNIAPDGEDVLDAHLREQLGRWRGDLVQYKTLADTGNYPGSQPIADALGVINKLLAEVDGRIVACSEYEHADTTAGRRDFRSFGHVHPAWRRRGIGAAMVRSFAEAGHDVLFTWRSGRERAEAKPPWFSRESSPSNSMPDACASSRLLDRPPITSSLVMRQGMRSNSSGIVGPVS